MQFSTSEKKAIEVGGLNAKKVLQFRKKSLLLREEKLSVENVKTFRFQPQFPNGDPINAQFEKSFIFNRVASKGALIAEGDSWFHYPWFDILSYLEDDGYEIESVAHRGDPVEAMAYDLGQLEKLVRRIEKVERKGVIPKAVLLSGGGNDIAGEHFGLFINHFQRGAPHLNELVLQGVIDDRIRFAYITLLTSITEICRDKFNETIPIIVHGYDYAVPDGRGYDVLSFDLAGPWLEPGFRQKGYKDLDLRISIVHELISRFNNMLQEVSELPEFTEHVNYINLQGTLSADLNDDHYQDWWNDEMHPTRDGFKEITKLFLDVIDNL